jgi:hypothetical protein
MSSNLPEYSLVLVDLCDVCVLRISFNSSLIGSKSYRIMMISTEYNSENDKSVNLNLGIKIKIVHVRPYF